MLLVHNYRNDNAVLVIFNHALSYLCAVCEQQTFRMMLLLLVRKGRAPNTATTFCGESRSLYWSTMPNQSLSAASRHFLRSLIFNWSVGNRKQTSVTLKMKKINKECP